MNSNITIRVRYNGYDPMGVVPHAVYPTWFEIGRTKLLRKKGGGYSLLEEQGVFFVVSELHLQYKKSAKYDDELTLLTEVSGTCPVRLHHTYTLALHDTIIAYCYSANNFSVCR